MEFRYKDRAEAGYELANLLEDQAGDPTLLVLALPRGGLPVAAPIAERLNAPLDVYLVRKLGVPGHEELAMGAIASGGTLVVNDSVVEHLGIPPAVIERVAAREMHELGRREVLYRGNRAFPRLTGRTVILVDDGLATGSTMRAALKAIRQHGPGRLIAAVPVGPSETCGALAEDADAMICAYTPDDFFGVGQFYDEFDQVSDDDVEAILTAARERMASAHASPAR